jgi:hypothetical protein
MKILDLKTVRVGEGLQPQLTDMMSNLPKLNLALQDANICDVETLRKMIKVEISTKKRPATLSRLLGRFKSLVGQEIDREVYGS